MTSDTFDHVDETDRRLKVVDHDEFFTFAVFERSAAVGRVSVMNHREAIKLADWIYDRAAKALGMPNTPRQAIEEPQEQEDYTNLPGCIL